ncbi:MAG: hypothetical protein PWP54_1635 [Thermosipho sp. (in: thermotogales)]|jgi:hypothetical protein|nr:hypothetical protein [Thermosipho sp. (in: thermotogales)]MDK2887055.1 hypothetical protein [Thermosipho sp. (in: thermotogales)]
MNNESKKKQGLKIESECIMEDALGGRSMKVLKTFF